MASYLASYLDGYCFEYAKAPAFGLSGPAGPHGECQALTCMDPAEVESTVPSLRRNNAILHKRRHLSRPVGLHLLQPIHNPTAVLVPLFLADLESTFNPCDVHPQSNNVLLQGRDILLRVISISPNDRHPEGLPRH